jgi:hypothetical protein
MMASCASPNDPADVQSANNTLIQNGIIHEQPKVPGQVATYATVGFGQLTEAQIISENHSCDGAAGSVVHPLIGNQCVLNALLLPITALINVSSALSGEQNDDVQHTDLTGIQTYFVHQDKQNDCWAAAFVMAREYQNLYPVSQQELLSHAYNVCPVLSSQNHGATLYQIYYVMKDLRKYDAGISPHFCNDSKCIVFSLLSGQPVIVLMSGHALLMVGADWEKLSDTDALILRARVLDPASKTATIKTLSSFQLCSADAFISY